VTTGERPEQRLADPLWVDRKRGIAELQHGGSNSFRKPLGDRSPRGGLEPDLVPAAQVRPSRAGDAAPGQILTDRGHVGASPRPRAATLSEMRGTASVSPRISDPSVNGGLPPRASFALLPARGVRARSRQSESVSLGSW
jgi:hypothetical protein